MKHLFTLLLVLLCPIFLFTSCSSSEEEKKDEPIRVIQNTTAPLKYGACSNPLVNFQVLPAETMQNTDVQVRFTDQSGNPLPYFEMGNLQKKDNGMCMATMVCKTDAPVKESVYICVTSGGRMGVSGALPMEYVDAALESFSIDGFKATIFETDKVISIVVPYIIDKTKVKPTFKVNSGRLLAGSKELISGKSEIDLSGDATLTLESGSIKKTYKVELENSGLPVVNISTPNNKAITSKDIWMEGASMTIHLPDGTLDYEGSMSIRGRGNSTWGYPKKPYAFKLDEKSEILGMPKHKRWVLLAQWKDRTLMRNDAAFWLSKQTDLDYTVRGQFVEVILNGKFLGNYYLCEQIKIDKNRVNVKEMNEMETDPSKITGGYLMELDTYFDEPRQFKSARFNLPWMFKEPDEEGLSDAAFNYFKGYVNGLEDILKDETRLKNHEYEELFDVDSSIDWFFVHELATNTEPHSWWPYEGPHSCYMHKDRGGKLISGPVWDFDYHGFCPDYAKTWVCRDALYYKALVKDEKYRNRMLERWAMLKDKFAKLPDYIDEMVDKISLSEKYNQDMWPINNNENGDEKMSFKEAIDRMKKAFKKKLDWMDANLKNLK